MTRRGLRFGATNIVFNESFGAAVAAQMKTAESPLRLSKN
jgi:hypothetical protein